MVWFAMSDIPPQVGKSERAQPLPIDPLLPEVVAALRKAQAVVIEAPPGAGKTTRIPRALMESGFASAGEILVLQPRRLPARLAAHRVAEELGQAPGRSVGFSVRFEDVSGPETRIRYITEGILTRRLLVDRTLAGVSVVVLDEFHERHLVTDLALALLRSLQAGRRPDLKVCVMSATLDAEGVQTYLGGCPRLRSEGRRFEVAVEHLPQPDDRPLAAQVASAARRLLREEPEGDLLVFLPGAAEIRRAQEALAALPGASELLILPLHGEMPLAEQSRAVRPASRRKVILSTNVAETSVTIDGVVAVIDSGLARVAAHSPFSGLPTLSLAKISQASAAQRAGRAGRTRPGRALRLYTRHDFDLRRPYDLPEIARTDLTETLLLLHGLGVARPQELTWLEPPGQPALATAEELLVRLGALAPSGGEAPVLTDLGRRMLRFPAHPRLARLICEGEDRGFPDGACSLAALISERDIREPSSGRRSGQSQISIGGHPEGGAELLDLLDLFRQAQAARLRPDRLRSLGLDPRAVTAVEKTRQQLARLCRSRPAPTAATLEEEEAALRVATLTGFPDRVARVRQPGERGVVLSAGGSAELTFPTTAPLLVAVAVEERSSAKGVASPAGRVAIRLACAIEPDWLLDVCADGLREVDELSWNPTTERVDRVSRLSYGAVVLEGSAQPAPASEEAARILAKAALAAGVTAFDRPEALSALTARVALIREILPTAPLPALDAAELEEALVAACAGLRSFAELRAQGLAVRLMQSFSAEGQKLLRTLAPENMTLPGGRTLAIHYQPGKPPWIESRLQDFFGMRGGPTVAGGRLPLTIHLLAPNGRAVQVTGDLESFWQQHYPSLRRELSRRYPRHSWPEDGRTAQPPLPRARR
jgi:ATP-dependent helicase HrpB